MPWYKKQPIAKAGLYDNIHIPENSYLAFEKAVEQKCAIALQLQVTKDNRIIVCQDNNLKRLTHVDIDVNKTMYTKIKKLTLLDSKEKIPLLKDVLNLIHGRVPILLQIHSHSKNGAMEKLICETISKYKGSLAIHSNQHFTLKWFKQHCSHIARGHMIMNQEQSSLETLTQGVKHMYHHWINKPDFIAVEQTMPTMLGQYYKNRNIPLISWKTPHSYNPNPYA